jgi:ElaB/YqjD/DUF883 family membrane-anchored ribosome-binding protein
LNATTHGNTPIAGNGDGKLNKISSGAHAAVDSLAGAVDEAARKAKPAIERVASLAHQAVDKAADAAAPTADWLAVQSESLKATQKKLMQDTCSYVSANPLKSVAIAVVTGFVLSRFLR